MKATDEPLMDRMGLNPRKTHQGPLNLPHTSAPSDTSDPSNETFPLLGPAAEAPPSSGQFQFADPQAPHYPQRFYRVIGP